MLRLLVIAIICMPLPILIGGFASNFISDGVPLVVVLAVSLGVGYGVIPACLLHIWPGQRRTKSNPMQDALWQSERAAVERQADSGMRALVDRLLSTRRKEWRRFKPMFERQTPVLAADITAIETRLEQRLPEDMRTWLILMGFGTINDDLNIQAGWFQLVGGSGHLKDGFMFAQDELGNFYACAPTGNIVFFDRHEPGHAVLAPTFRVFLEELELRAYKIMDWVDSVKLAPYEWG